MPDPEVVELIRATAASAGIPQRTFTDEEIVERCIYALINEGARIARGGLGAARRPTSTSSTSTATASRPGAAARCSTPIASGWRRSTSASRAFHRELGDALGAGAAARAAGRARARRSATSTRAAAADAMRPTRPSRPHRSRRHGRRRGADGTRLRALAARARRRTRRGSPSGSSTGRAHAPDRTFLARRDATGRVAAAHLRRRAATGCARSRRRCSIAACRPTGRS